jgi:hypothetical protein
MKHASVEGDINRKPARYRIVLNRRLVLHAGGPLASSIKLHCQILHKGRSTKGGGHKETKETGLIKNQRRTEEERELVYIQRKKQIEMRA